MKKKHKHIAALAGLALTAGSANAALTSQLGVLDLDANGGLNPKTGVAWQSGDTYRLMFVSSAGIDATSSNIATYNTFVDGLATTAGYGSVNWTAFVSTAESSVGAADGVSAINNTGLTWVASAGNAGDQSIGESIWLMNGTEYIASNYSDFWDGHTSAEAIDRSELNGSGLNNGSYASLWTGTSSQGNISPNAGMGDPSGNTMQGIWTSAANASQWVQRWTGDQATFGTDNGKTSIYGVSEVLTVVPEPSTTALLGLGGLALILRRRK